MFSTNYYYESVVDVQNQFIDKYICENYRLSSVFHIKNKKVLDTSTEIDASRSQNSLRTSVRPNPFCNTCR